MIQPRTHRAAAALALAALAVASPSSAAPNEAKPAPNDAAPAAAPPAPPPKAAIGLSNIVVRIEGQDDIGLAGADVKIRIIERMRERGFTAVGAESLVFDKDESRRAEFRLGAIVRELDCAVYASRNNCVMGIEWQLLDVAKDAVVYKVVTRSAKYGINEEKGARVAIALLVEALDSLLARAKFRAMLAAGAHASAPVDATFDAASFARCAPLAKRMPEAAEQVLRATVVVKTKDGFGSGFFVSADGLVVTAAHVLHDGTTTLRLRDGTETDAIAIRVAPGADVALLRPAKPLVPPQCLAAGLAEPAMGTELYAAGAPARLELAFSLTRGIVSAVRERDGRRYLQTDAPVSPGNSGGPLVDATGAVLAVTSSKLAGGAVEGVGFGIPIATAFASLGVSAGDATDQKLRDAPPMEKRAPVEPEAIVDTPDAKPSIDPEGDKRRAAEARVRSERAKQQAVIDAKRAREDARDAATPTALKVVHWGGLGLAGAGAIAGLLTFSSYDSATTTRSDFRRLQLENGLAWAAAGLGAVGFFSFYVFRPPLPPEAPAKYSPPARTMGLSLGLGGVHLNGAF